jgi:hypothetical protein
MQDFLHQLVLVAATAKIAETLEGLPPVIATEATLLVAVGMTVAKSNLSEEEFLSMTRVMFRELKSRHILRTQAEQHQPTGTDIN